MDNSPTNYTNSSGQFIDELLDAAFIINDINNIVTSGRKDLGWNLTYLGADVLGALIPGVTGLGKVAHFIHDAEAGGDVARAGDHFFDGLKSACSFSADTEVATSQGEKPISEIEAGDKVLAYDQKTGKEGYYTVKRVLVHKDKVIEHLSVDGESLDTTPEHPFYTKEQGWVPAGQLKAGMHVREADGEYGVVQSLSLERHTERMFNLTVDGAHTFLVGEKQLLVHNMYWPNNA